MKKTLSLILALLMSVSCASYIFADDAEVTAISEDAAVEEAVEEVETPAEEATPYDRAIRFLTTYNVMHGYEDGLLHAEKDVERYQMALFIGRITTGWVEDDTWEDFDANDSGFSDLKGTAAENVYGAMSYVSQKGIIEGYPDGTFKPEKVVTYREALTMAVRALGYQGLEYPWGYIEKAVSLGLTDGITGVAYTDVINRGVAAQIIYNAMFADGSKLAAKNFDGALGWANIIVTSSVITDDVKAEYTTAEYKTPVDYVSFQVIESDGTLGKDVYYVKASELALDEGHADELALGTPYAALFKIDDDKNYVELIDYEAYAPTTVKNEGRTDNEGVEYEVVDKIGAFLKDYTLVDKYSAKILANAGKLANELIVATAAKVEVVTGVDYSKTPYAFDWNTGDILLWNAKDEVYEVEWKYDAAFDYYFKVKTVKAVDEEGKTVNKPVGIEIMDESDVAKLREAIDKACQVTAKDTAYTFVKSVGSAIYATLNAYNVDADAEADYATYEAYSYGYIGQGKKSIGDNCGEKPAVTINGAAIDVIDATACDHTDGIWWQDEYAPVLDEDGKIVSAYVIYGYNPVTKELKVIKTIEAYSDDLVDADTYYATGILRGYSISKGYVVIGDQKIYFNTDFGSFDVDNEKVVLKDGKEVNYKKGDAYKEILTNKFDTLFNQFVRYYVLDGKVVEIETVGDTTSNYIVVESYAGISNDGYIVVNGYSTNELKLDRFKLAVVNQWNNGDYFWYGYEAFADQAFAKGQVYKITSYDAENELYFVDTIATVECSDNTGVEIEVKTDAKEATITIKEGYRLYNGTDPKKVTSNDKYIIIGEGKDGYMPIAVYAGKATNGWTVTGQVLVGDKDASTFIIVNAKRGIIGFNADAWSNSGLVLVVKKTVLDKFYDAANEVAGEEWYLNGATEYSDILVFNFLTGKFDYATASTNVNVAVGNVYKTIDGVITGKVVTNNWDTIWETLTTTYADKDVATADYIFDDVVVVDYNFFSDSVSKIDPKDYVSLNEVSRFFFTDPKFSVKGLVNSLTIVKVITDDNKAITVAPYGKDDFKKDIEKKGIESFVADGIYKINENGTVDAVIYVTDVVAAGETVDKGETEKTSNVIGITADAGILGSVTFDKKVTTEYDADLKKAVDTTLYTIKGIGFELTGSAALRNNHSDVVNDGLYFDVLPRCTEADDWDVTFAATKDTTATIGFPAAKKVYGEEITYTTFDNHDEEENPGCNLIKGFSFGIDEITLAEGQVAYLKANFNVQGTYNRTCDVVVYNNAGKLEVFFYNGTVAEYQNIDNGTPIDPVASVK